MALYQATLTVCLNVENEGEACDYLSELLRDELMSKSGILKDWQYVRAEDGKLLSPSPISENMAIGVFSEYGHY